MLEYLYFRSRHLATISNMRAKYVAFVTLLLPFLYAHAIQAQTTLETTKQLDAIKIMGQLYGTALPCNYIQQTREIKTAMVTALPKKRYLGQAFEEATNEAFLQFHKDGAKCPSEDALQHKIDTAIDTLNNAFNG